LLISANGFDEVSQLAEISRLEKDGTTHSKIISRRPGAFQNRQDMTNKMGYHRRDPEVAELELLIANYK